MSRDQAQSELNILERKYAHGGPGVRYSIVHRIEQLRAIISTYPKPTPKIPQPDHHLPQLTACGVWLMHKATNQ